MSEVPKPSSRDLKRLGMSLAVLAAQRLADPEVRAQLEKIGGMIPAPMSPAEATKEYEAQTARFRAIARAIKLQAQ